MNKLLKSVVYLFLIGGLQYGVFAQYDDVYYDDQKETPPETYTTTTSANNRVSDDNNRSTGVNSSGYEDNNTFGNNTSTGANYDDDYYDYSNDYGYGYGNGYDDGLYYTNRFNRFSGSYNPYLYDNNYWNSMGYGSSMSFGFGAGNYWNYNRFHRNQCWWDYSPYYGGNYGYNNYSFCNSPFSYGYGGYSGYGGYYGGYPYVVNNYYGDYYGNGTGRYTDPKVYGSRRGGVVANPGRGGFTSDRDIQIRDKAVDTRPQREPRTSDDRAGRVDQPRTTDQNTTPQKADDNRPQRIERNT